MRLIRFQVTNFRSVVDSGWIDAERVTALIGVNESGKTNLLLPLWKLNPAREGEIKPTSDYPKGNYAAVRAAPGSFPFIHAEFVPTDAVKMKLVELTGLDENLVGLVCVHRFFDGRHTVTFPNFKKADELGSADLIAILTAAEVDIGAMNQLSKEGNLKADIQSALASAKQSDGPVSAYDAEALDAIAAPLLALLPETPAATSSIVPRLNLLIQDLQAAKLKLLAPAPNEIDEVKLLIIASLPRFVYYSNYGNLDSEIYLPHVVQNLARGDLGAKEAAKARTLRVLFNFVQLQPNEILELGRDFNDPTRQPNEQEIAGIATKKRERTILLNSAGTDLTKKFRNWWKQGDYTFEFQADGDHFRIWVTDSKRPEKIELEDRSSGLQWFLSFYLIFLVESSGVHANAILLLDEPGLSLHPLAQRDLSAFFENLASTIPFADVVKPGEPIVPQIEAWAKKEGVPLDDGWKVDVAREAKRRALESAKPLFDNAILDNWAKLFEDMLSES